MAARRWRTGAAIVALTAALLAAAATPALATFPGKPGAIAFDADGWIQTVRVGRHGGVDRQRLAEGIQPSFSADGRRIVFVSRGGRQLTVMNGDGSNPHAVYESHSLDDPCFSADGRRLYFTRDTSGEGYSDLWVVRIGAASAHRLTHTGFAGSESSAEDAQAAANGRYVVFARDGWVWTMRPDGSRQRRLTRGTSPSISPDSRRVVVQRYEKLVVVGAGGGSERVYRPVGRKRQGELTRSAASPAFSPDGRSIAFDFKRTTSYGPGLHFSSHLSVFTPATGRTLTLTPGSGIEARNPDWGPLP